MNVPQKVKGKSQVLIRHEIDTAEMFTQTLLLD